MSYNTAWLPSLFAKAYNYLFVGGVQAPQQGSTNLIAGANTTISYADNPTLGRTDVTIASTGGTTTTVQDVSAGGTLASTATRGLGVIKLVGSPSGAFAYTLPSGGEGTYQIANASSKAATIGSFVHSAGATQTYWTDGSTVAIVPQTAIAPLAAQLLSWNGSAWVPSFGSGPVYNVLDYGLDNTGTNANDVAFALLRSTIVSVGTGGKVYFPKGQYLFNFPVTVFPDGVCFEGDNSATTKLLYSGTGDFFVLGAFQCFERLSVVSILSNAYTTNPGRQNIVIATASASAGAATLLTTATAHGYVSGDKIGIYGMPITTNVNNDPITLHTITVTSPTQFTIPVAFSGSYTPTTVSITGASSSTPIVLTTGTAHGLLNNQLIFVAGVTGNANANGLSRTYWTPAPGTSTTAIVNNVYANTRAYGPNTYAGGGTITTGGVCVNYSANALGGLYLGPGSGSVLIRNTTVSNFKYPIRNSGGEKVFISDQTLLNHSSNYGYTYDSLTNDSTHSAFGLQITTDLSTGIYADDVSFFGYGGVYHGDGYTHHVKNCTFESDTVCHITKAASVTSHRCSNDGSNDSQGIVKIVNDLFPTAPVETSAYALELVSSAFSGNGRGCVYVDAGSQLIGLITQGLKWGSGGDIFVVDGATGGYVDLDGASTQGTRLTNSVQALRVGVNGKDITNSGMTVNHWGNAYGALDIGFNPIAGTSPAPWHGLILRDPNPSIPDTRYAGWNWTTALGPWNGFRQEWQAIPGSIGYPQQKCSRTAGWHGFTAGTTNAVVAVMDAGYCAASILTVSVLAAVNGAEQTEARWKWRQRLYYPGTGGVIVFGAVEELEVWDDIGLTTPALAVTGAAPNCSVTITCYSWASAGVAYSVVLDLEQVAT